MKFSKSILIFLFVSSTLSIFYYGLKRTNGNIWKSVIFTIYFLGIKFGLIGLNEVTELRPHQAKQQIEIVATARVLPFYHPYVSVLGESYYRPSSLYMSKTEMPAFVPEYSHSAKSITQLRAGGRLSEAAWLFMTIWMLQQHSVGFQPVKQASPPLHLQWLYGNNYQPGQFGYGKGAESRSSTVTGLTQNAGSNKKEPSAGSYNYIDIMRELNKQSNKKIITIQVANQTYNIKNHYCENAYELADKLADQIYDSIKKCDTDICDIAANIGFKADNIKNVKDHIFYKEHELDQYVSLGEKSEHKRFDPNFQQALAWKRLEAGTHNQDDITWIKHECAERHHELKYSAGYSESHARAQSRFDGAPWEDNW